MKNWIAACILGVAVVGTTVPQGGCAALYGETPQEQFENVIRDFRLLVDTLVLAHEAGKIDDETFTTIVWPLIQEGEEILRRYEEALLAGEVDQERIMRDAVRGIVARLLVYAVSQ